MKPSLLPLIFLGVCLALAGCQNYTATTATPASGPTALPPKAATVTAFRLTTQATVMATPMPYSTLTPKPTETASGTPPPQPATLKSPLLTIPFAPNSEPGHTWIMRYAVPVNGPVALSDLSIYTIAVSPDGKLLAVGGGAPFYVVTLLDASTGVVIRQIAAYQAANQWTPVKQIVFSPDGKTLVGVGHDQLARIWDVNTGLLLRNLAWHTDRTLMAFFTPDHLLGVSSLDKTIRYWNEAGERVKKETYDAPVYSMVYWPTGHAEGIGGTLQVWEGHGGMGHGYPGPMVAAIVHDEQRTAALLPGYPLGATTLVICTLDAAAGDCREAAHGSYAGLGVLSPHFVYGDMTLIRIDENNQVLFDTGHRVTTLTTYSGLIVVGSADGLVSLWQYR